MHTAFSIPSIGIKCSNSSLKLLSTFHEHFVANINGKLDLGKVWLRAGGLPVSKEMPILQIKVALNMRFFISERKVTVPPGVRR